MKYLMFIDDDKNLLDSMKRMLHPLKDKYDISFFTNAKDALETLKNVKIQIVFVDYKMPEMDGLEFLTTVKDTHPEIKRILLTGQSEEEVYIKAKNLVHKYISKPCEFEDIIKAIEEK